MSNFQRKSKSRKTATTPQAIFGGWRMLSNLHNAGTQTLQTSRNTFIGEAVKHCSGCFAIVGTQEINSQNVSEHPHCLQSNKHMAAALRVFHLKHVEAALGEIGQGVRGTKSYLAYKGKLSEIHSQAGNHLLTENYDKVRDLHSAAVAPSHDIAGIVILDCLTKGITPNAKKTSHVEGASLKKRQAHMLGDFCVTFQGGQPLMRPVCHLRHAMSVEDKHNIMMRTHSVLTGSMRQTLVSSVSPPLKTQKVKFAKVETSASRITQSMLADFAVSMRHHSRDMPEFKASSLGRHRIATTPSSTSAVQVESEFKLGQLGRALVSGSYSKLEIALHQCGAYVLEFYNNLVSVSDFLKTEGVATDSDIEAHDMRRALPFNHLAFDDDTNVDIRRKLITGVTPHSIVIDQVLATWFEYITHHVQFLQEAGDIATEQHCIAAWLAVHMIAFKPSHGMVPVKHAMPQHVKDASVISHGVMWPLFHEMFHMFASVINGAVIPTYGQSVGHTPRTIIVSALDQIASKLDAKRNNVISLAAASLTAQ